MKKGNILKIGLVTLGSLAASSHLYSEAYGQVCPPCRHLGGPVPPQHGGSHTSQCNNHIILERTPAGGGVNFDDYAPTCHEDHFSHESY